MVGILNDILNVINQRTGESEQVYREGLLNLANAIIERAIMDYTDEHATHYERNQIERFFWSEYFLMLSGDVFPRRAL